MFGEMFDQASFGFFMASWVCFLCWWCCVVVVVGSGGGGGTGVVIDRSTYCPLCMGGVMLLFTYTTFIYTKARKCILVGNYV